jgi:hypothetical protein
MRYLKKESNFQCNEALVSKTSVSTNSTIQASEEERSRTLSLPVRSRAIYPVNLLLQIPRGGAQTPFHLLRGYFPSSGWMDSNHRPPASKAGNLNQLIYILIKQKTLLLAGLESLANKISAQPTTIISLPIFIGAGRSSCCVLEFMRQI